MKFTFAKDQMLAVLEGRRYVFVPGGLCTECAFDVCGVRCRLMHMGVRDIPCVCRNRSDNRVGHWKEADG